MRSNGNSQTLTVRVYGGQNSRSQDVLQSLEVEAHTVRVPGGTEWHVQPGITFTYRPNEGRPWWYVWRRWYPKIYLTALRVSAPKEVAHLGVEEIAVPPDPLRFPLTLCHGDTIRIDLPENLIHIRAMAD